MAEGMMIKRAGSSKKANLEKARARDEELVRGRFVFYEVPGGTLTFAFRKYGVGKKPVQYSLKDGETYKLPRMVAKHLAVSGGYPVHEYMTDEKGNPTVRIGRVKKRYNFESLEFFDDLDTKESGLYTVEKI